MDRSSSSGRSTLRVRPPPPLPLAPLPRPPPLLSGASGLPLWTSDRCRGRGGASRGAPLYASLRAAHLAAFGTPMPLLRCASVGVAAVAGLLASRRPWTIDMTWGSVMQHAGDVAGCCDKGRGLKGRGPTELSGDKYSIVYDCLGGPAGRASVVVTPRGTAAPTSHDFDKFLDSVGVLSSSGQFCSGVVAIFDSTHLVWPSLFSIPQIVSVLRERPPPEVLRDNTQAIVIVHRESRFFQLLVTNLVEIVVALTQPTIIPMFATSQQAAQEVAARHLQV